MEQTSPPFQSHTRLPAEITDTFLNVLREFGVVQASVFGSIARGDAGADSDIDLLVRFEPPVTLFRQIELAHTLERVSGRPVDVVTNIHPAFRPYILPTLMPLPI